MHLQSRLKTKVGHDYLLLLYIYYIRQNNIIYYVDFNETVYA